MRGGWTVPVGTIISFIGKAVPENYLFCDGSEFSKEEHPKLFELLESSTLPNINGRFLEGSSTPMIYHEAGLPNLMGGFRYGKTGISYLNVEDPSGVFFGEGEGINQVQTGGKQVKGMVAVGFNAHNYNAIYGNANTVQPSSLTVRYLIRAK